MLKTVRVEWLLGDTRYLAAGDLKEVRVYRSTCGMMLPLFDFAYDPDHDRGRVVKRYPDPLEGGAPFADVFGTVTDTRDRLRMIARGQGGLDPRQPTLKF